MKRRVGKNQCTAVQAVVVVGVARAVVVVVPLIKRRRNSSNALQSPENIISIIRVFKNAGCYLNFSEEFALLF